MKLVVVIDGKRNGPHEPETVKALHDSGEVTENDLAWREGMTEWLPLHVVCPELFSKPMESSTATPPASESTEPAGQEATGAKTISEEPVSSENPVTEQASDPNEQEEAIEHERATNTLPPENLYLGVDGKKCGPFSPDETMAKLLSGDVQGDVLAWTKGMSEWKPLMEIWPGCANVATISEKHATDLQTSLFKRLRDELRKE